MSKRITIEEEKEMASLYRYYTQRGVRDKTGHGWTQVNRTLQPKNIALLLFHEMQSHDLTKYANKHLQEELGGAKFLLIVTGLTTWALGFLLAYYL